MGEETKPNQPDEQPQPPELLDHECPWLMENGGKPLSRDEQRLRDQWRRKWYADELSGARERRLRWLESQKVLAKPTNKTANPGPVTEQMVEDLLRILHAEKSGERRDRVADDVADIDCLCEASL
jgi:hypothetical protein